MTWRLVRCVRSGYGAAECAEDMHALDLSDCCSWWIESKFFAFWVVSNDTGKAAESRVASEIIDDAT